MVIHIIIICDRKVSIEFTNDNITYDIYHLPLKVILLLLVDHEDIETEYNTINNIVHLSYLCICNGREYYLRYYIY